MSFGFSGKNSPCLSMNSVELLGRVLTAGVLGQQRVEVGHHLPDRLHGGSGSPPLTGPASSRRTARRGPPCAASAGSAQCWLALGAAPVVVVQLADLARGVLRQRRRATSRRAGRRRRRRPARISRSADSTWSSSSRTRSRVPARLPRRSSSRRRRGQLAGAARRARRGRRGRAAAGRARASRSDEPSMHVAGRSRRRPRARRTAGPAGRRRRARRRTGSRARAVPTARTRPSTGIRQLP